MPIIPKGRWFDDFVVGETIHHALTRTITESDNVMFTTQTMNPAPLHLDAAYAETTAFGRPLVNSMLTIGIVVGISVHETTHGTTVANLGFEEIVFPGPLFHGDTIRAETEVMAVRPSNSKPDRGIVTFEHRAYKVDTTVADADQTLVCRARRNALMWRETATSA